MNVKTIPEGNEQRRLQADSLKESDKEIRSKKKKKKNGKNKNKN